MKLFAQTLILAAFSLSACNSPAPITDAPLEDDMNADEQAYYDSCPTNPACRASHVLSVGETAQVEGTLVTKEDEKSAELLNTATAYIENFMYTEAMDRAAFLPSDYPEELKNMQEFAVGKVLGYDDKYVYVTMNFVGYIKENGELVEHSGSANIPYRFEYNSETLGIVDHKEAGEGQEALTALFPEEVLAAYSALGQDPWQTDAQTAEMKARAELSIQ